MIARYKEIIFGFGLGLGMWLIDAAMHVQIGDYATSWAGSFMNELFYPGPAQLFFRMLFLAMATFSGFILWRSNQQQRQARALEEAVRKLYRGMAAPTMLILGYSRNLLTDPMLMADGSAQTLIEGIYESAFKLKQLTEEVSAAEEGEAMVVSSSEQVYAGKPTSASRALR
jgi:hypothetical protein